jgi:thiol-disulfide isomerase/thioredoxin
MTKSKRFLVTALAPLLCVLPALAEEPTVEELKAQLDQVQAELKAARQDMAKILAELQALKNAQANRPQPAQQQQRPAMGLLGKPAPKHKVSLHQGGEAEIGGNGKVQYAFFYASWCGFCKRSLPSIEKLYQEKYKDNKDVEFVLVNLDDRGQGPRAKTPEQTLETYNELKLTLPLHMDDDKSVGRDYKVSSFPTSFVIGKDGTVQAVHIGGPTTLGDQVGKEIDQLLAGQSLVKPVAAAAQPNKTGGAS